MLLAIPVVISALPMHADPSASQVSAIIDSHFSRIAYGGLTHAAADEFTPPVDAGEGSHGDGSWIEADSYAEFQSLPSHARHLQPKRPQGTMRHPGVASRSFVTGPEHGISTTSIPMPAVVRKLRYGSVKPRTSTQNVPSDDGGPLAHAEALPEAPADDVYAWMPFPVNQHAGAASVAEVQNDALHHRQETPVAQTSAIAPEHAPMIAPPNLSGAPALPENRFGSAARSVSTNMEGGNTDPATVVTMPPEPQHMVNTDPVTEIWQGPEPFVAGPDGQATPPQPGFIIPESYVASGVPLLRPEKLAAAKHNGVPLSRYVLRPEVLGISSRSPIAGRMTRTVRNNATQADVWEGSGPHLLAVFKRGSRYSALIRLPDGTIQNVKRGSSFDGGKLVSITTHEAVYTKDGSRHTLRIK